MNQQAGPSAARVAPDDGTVPARDVELDSRRQRMTYRTAERRYARNMSGNEPYVTVSSDALARIVALLRGLAPGPRRDPVGRVG